MDNTIHFILQGKGGIGKSFVAVMLAQFFKSKGANLKAFDTDQENTTFAHYKALGAEHIPVMNESRTIDAKRFDSLMEKLLTDEGTFVIDNGANTFSPLLAYMVENDVVSFLTDNGKKVYLHTVVGGGDTLTDTANGFNSIAQGIEGVPLVLWLNEHFGPMKTVDGKEFTDTKVFKTKSISNSATTYTHQNFICLYGMMFIILFENHFIIFNLNHFSIQIKVNSFFRVQFSEHSRYFRIVIS